MAGDVAPVPLSPLDELPAALASGAGIGLVALDDGVVVVLLLDEGVVVLLLDAGGVDGVVVAPVSSTFLPQAPSASKAARAREVKAAGLSLDASMSGSLYKAMKIESKKSTD